MAAGFQVAKVHAALHAVLVSCLPASLLAHGPLRVLLRGVANEAVAAKLE